MAAILEVVKLRRNDDEETRVTSSQTTTKRTKNNVRDIVARAPHPRRDK